MNNADRERAFPCDPNTYDEGKGMTLRDYFAAMAMQGLLASPRGDPNRKEITDISVSENAYLVANAMMVARL